MGDPVQQLGDLAAANLPDRQVFPGRQQMAVDPALILPPGFLLRFRVPLQELARQRPEPGRSGSQMGLSVHVDIRCSPV
jgi:hypothetical protein